MKNKVDFTIEKGLIVSDGYFESGTETRYLDDIRKSLKNESSKGPEVLYRIAMDVGREMDASDLHSRNLLYGIVVYNKGMIGDEPIRSQGHVHSLSSSCNYSTPEVYEILKGKAIIYMQESIDYEPGQCYAVQADVGDIVIVPPGWAHFTLNADIENEMVFGAWCIRDYSFEYTRIREMNGLSWYPVIKNKKITWEKNNKYRNQTLLIKDARKYPEFNVVESDIYQQYILDKNHFDFVTNPKDYVEIWDNFIP